MNRQTAKSPMAKLRTKMFTLDDLFRYRDRDRTNTMIVLPIRVATMMTARVTTRWMSSGPQTAPSGKKVMLASGIYEDMLSSTIMEEDEDVPEDEVLVSSTEGGIIMDTEIIQEREMTDMEGLFMVIVQLMAFSSPCYA